MGTHISVIVLPSHDWLISHSNLITNRDMMITLVTMVAAN